MEDTKNPSSNSGEKNSTIDFELDSMDYALKGMTPQNKNIPFEEKKAETTEVKPPPGTIPKIEKAPLSQSVNSSTTLKNSLNKFPVPNPVPAFPQKNKRSSLTLILSVILLLAISGGAFYYFQYYSKNSQPPVAENVPTPTPSPSPSPTPELEILPPFSNQIGELILGTESLSERILTLKQQAAADPVLNGHLLVGTFYQVSKDGQILSAQELLQAMDVSLPVETAQMFKKGWIFINLNEKSILKTALVLTVDETTYNNAGLLLVEKDLPLLLKNLFIEEDSSVQETEIAFQVSNEDARLRFFNFAKDDDTRTIDWAKINDYLFFATSKNTAFKLISVLDAN